MKKQIHCSVLGTHTKRLSAVRSIVVIVLLLSMWIPTLWYEFISDQYFLRWLTGWTVPVALLCGLILAFRWRSIIPAMLILASPLALNFGFGAVDWFGNRPSFYGRGLPGLDASNLDSNTRCYFSSGGCVIVGGEWVLDIPHNLGLRLMTTVLGRPPRVYGGPYPSREEVAELTENAPQTKPEDFLKGEIRANGKPMTVGRDTSTKILQDLGQTEFEFDSDFVQRSVRAAIYKERCLIVRVQTRNTLLANEKSLEDDTNRDGCILFDLRSNRAFARYGFHGNMNRVPRLLYQD